MLLSTLTYIAWAASAFFCIKVLLMILGLEDHGNHIGHFDAHSVDVLDSDTDSDVDNSDSDFKLFSLQSILAFLMGFGWSGKAFIEDFNLSTTKSLFLAILFGFVLALLITKLIQISLRLNSVYVPNISECKGKRGVVYTEVTKEGGQVEISCGGKVMFLNAVGAELEDVLSHGTSVEVIGVSNRTLIVKKIQ